MNEVSATYQETYNAIEWLHGLTRNGKAVPGVRTFYNEQSRDEWVAENPAKRYNISRLQATQFSRMYATYWS